VTFRAGDAKPPGSGRAPGQPNRKTSLINAGLRSAIETLRHGDGPDPIAAAFKVAKFLEGMTQARLTKLATEIGALSGEEFDRVRETLKEAANIHLKLANYAFPKLRAHEYLGDAPTTIVQENKVVQFVLVDPHAKTLNGHRAAAGGDGGERVLDASGRPPGGDRSEGGEDGDAHDDGGVSPAVVLPGAAGGDL
jgi:hypothetical protein